MVIKLEKHCFFTVSSLFFHHFGDDKKPKEVLSPGTTSGVVEPLSHTSKALFCSQ
jgi:hypothetical protein